MTAVEFFGIMVLTQYPTMKKSFLNKNLLLRTNVMDDRNYF